MKKFLGLTMAAICAVTVAAGFSACSNTPDDVTEEVTEEEWIAALSMEDTLNLSIDATATYYTKCDNTDGTTAENTYNMTYKLQSGFTDHGTYVTGNALCQYTITQNMVGYGNARHEEWNGDHTIVTACSMYESFAEDAYSIVVSYAYKDDSEDYTDWSGAEYDGTYAAEYSSVLSMADDVISYTDYCINSYADFTYTEGAYTYSEVDEDGVVTTYVVKIKDGCLTYLSLESYEAYTYRENAIQETEKYEINFSGYGKTTVSIPEEYTYEYYLANHSED